MKDIFLKLMSNILKNYMNFIMIYHFYFERMQTEQDKKLAVSIHDKTKYVKHKRNLKRTLNHGLVLKKVHSIIKFKQKAWIKYYIDMNTDFCKRFF